MPDGQGALSGDGAEILNELILLIFSNTLVAPDD
jgi:hypothetical protein